MRRSRRASGENSARGLSFGLRPPRSTRCKIKLTTSPWSAQLPATFHPDVSGTRSSLPPMDAASKKPDGARAGLPILVKAQWRERLALSHAAEVALVWGSAAFASLVYLFRKGQDINWDQLNYHIYSVYSLINNRAELDIIPSQLQTWTNPFGNLLPYFLIRNTSPTIASAILAVTAALAVPLVYFLTKNI